MPAAQEITDLDALCAPPRKVRAGGKDWRVPGAAPLGWLFAFRELERKLATDEDLDELDLYEALRDQIADLFEIHQAGKRDQIAAALNTLDVPVLLAAVRAIYQGQAEEVEEVEEVPPPRRTAGTRSTSRSRTAKRSRSSG